MKLVEIVGICVTFSIVLSLGLLIGEGYRQYSGQPYCVPYFSSIPVSYEAEKEKDDQKTEVNTKTTSDSTNTDISKSTKRAFITSIGHSNPGHCEMMAANLQCLRNMKPAFEIGVLADEIDKKCYARLLKMNITFIDINKRFNESTLAILRGIPLSERKGAFSKLLSWGLIEYDKVIYLDTDVTVWRNIDELFDQPELSAVQDLIEALADRAHPVAFNSGLMVLRPNLKTLDDLLNLSKHFNHWLAEMGMLNSYFAKNWNRLPIEYNVIPAHVKKGNSDVVAGHGVKNVAAVHHVHEKMDRLISPEECKNFQCPECCIRHQNCRRQVIAMLP